MHGRLLVIGEAPRRLGSIDDFDPEIDLIHRLLPPEASAMLGGGAASGCLTLVEGGEGFRAIELMPPDAPTILLDDLASRPPAVPGGVDIARKKAIANLGQLAALVRPAWVIRGGSIRAAQGDLSVWLKTVDSWLQQANADDWVSVFDVHL